MSTFTSVVNKSGKKIVPKATARRNVVSRASSSTPSSSDPPLAPRPVPLSIRDAVEAPDASQVQRVAEQDVASSAPPALAPQTAGTSTSLDVVPPGTYQVTNAIRVVRNPRLTGPAKKDAMRGRWAANQEKTYKDRVTKRQSRAQVTAIENNESAHQQSSLSGVKRKDGANFEEEYPRLALSRRSTRSREDCARKISARSGS